MFIGSTTVYQNSQIIISGTVSIGSNAVLSLIVPSNSATLSTAVISYANISGSFLFNVSSPTECSSIQDVTPLYGTSTLSVTVHVVAVSSCASGLSAGAIAGIAIGCVIVGSLVVVAVVLSMRHQWRMMERELKAKELENISSLQVHAVHL